MKPLKPDKKLFSCVDIDECAINNGGCHAGATCSNTEGAFTCTCPAGYEGDGFTCFFSEHEISEMREPTGLKFCTMVSTRPNFIMPVQNFGRHTPKKIQGPKTAKFGPISDDFEVRRRISPKRMKIFKIG